MNMILNKIKAWIYDNRFVVLYAVFACVLEGVAVFTIEGTFFLSRPFISVGVLLIFVGVALLVKNDAARLWICAFFLAVQLIADLLLIMIYEMTGQYFYYEMLNLRNDAVATIESIPVHFFTFYTGVFLCVAYIIYGRRTFAKEKEKEKVPKTESNNENTKNSKNKNSIAYRIFVCVLGIFTVAGSVMSYYPRSIEDKYAQMISGRAENIYASYGLIGNFVGEFGSKIWEKKVVPNDETIENFLYAENKVAAPTSYFGVSKDKNVVMILAESLEWFAFLNDAPNTDKYPNALPFTKSELAMLYPNLTKFYNESVIADNFHSKEKTDASETLSILGSYPLDGYVTYDYPEVVMPSSLPNMLSVTQGEMQKRSFHNGDKNFYNRIKTHLSFGFDEEMWDKTDMESYANERAEATGEAPAFTNYADLERGEYNLDSEMLETCKDVMFPTDKRFFTYITTITMHGAYVSRENLQEYEEIVIQTLGERLPEATENEKWILLYYMTTAMDLDRAIGIMMEDLANKDLLDDTLIVLFGDHNAYYNSLSNYVKDIDDYDTERNYTDLYKVPLMIYDADLTKKVGQSGRVVNKFTCTADIVPTVLDLLGIKYYGNMYYGHSVFSNRQSVLYSRGYDFFASDGIVATSVKKVTYRYADVTIGEGEAFETEAITLVEKMKYCDYIFIKNWYKNQARRENFERKIRFLNDVG